MSRAGVLLPKPTAHLSGSSCPLSPPCISALTQWTVHGSVDSPGSASILSQAQAQAKLSAPEHLHLYAFFVRIFSAYKCSPEKPRS